MQISLWVLAHGKTADDCPLPAIIKPAAEDASAGLDRQSVLADRKLLRTRIAAKMTPRSSTAFKTPATSSAVQSSAPWSYRTTTLTPSPRLALPATGP